MSKVVAPRGVEGGTGGAAPEDRARRIDGLWFGRVFLLGLQKFQLCSPVPRAAAAGLQSAFREEWS